MLEITIPSTEYYDEKTESFIRTKEWKLKLEHSLVSLSKWESKWKKPFFGKTGVQTFEENVDYIRCMTITQNVDPLVYLSITPEIFEQVQQYIGDSMTATRFPNQKKGPKNYDTITSEILYYQMIELGIPSEYQKWHLNRLMALIRVCALKNMPPKKMTKKEIYSHNKALNEARRRKLNSRG